MKPFYSWHTSPNLKILFALLAMLFASSCGAANLVSLPRANPSPTPSCESSVCINNVYLQIVGDETLLIQFDLVDENYEVRFGEEPTLKSKITFAIYLDQDSGEDTYLAGMNPSLDSYQCYTGNDIPWSNGSLASTCGLAVPLSMLQFRPKEGDPIRVDIIRPEFNRSGIWLPAK